MRGVVKAVGAKPRPKLRPWGGGEDRGGVAKAVRAWSTSLAKDVGSWPRPKEG